MTGSVVLVEEQKVALVAQRADAVVVSERPMVMVLAAGGQGPQGPAGPSGGQYATRPAGSVLGGHRVVRSLSDGRVGYASVDDATHGDDTLGLTVASAVEDADINILRGGSIEHSGWAWTPGDPVFLSTDGTLTQATPTEAGGAAFIQVIGHAETATTLFVSPQPPIYF